MRNRLAIGLVAAIIVFSLVVARRHELLRVAVQTGGTLASGQAVEIAQLRVGWDASALYGIRVGTAGEPLLQVRRVVLRYSLRDLLPASRHRFGLLAVEIDGARLTLTRFRDGSFNLKFPQIAARPAPERINAVPVRFSLRVSDSQVTLREPLAFDPSAKMLRVSGIDVSGTFDGAGVTQYRVRGTFDADRPAPFTVEGKIDALAGYATHHAHAASFPLRALANYLADTPAIRVLAADGRNLDAWIYALGVEPNENPAYHVGMHLDVDGGRLALQALAAPVEGLQARVQVIDNAFFVRGARAALAGIPLRIDGGGYDLTGALTGRAQLRLGISGEGDLSALRQAFTFARDQPLAGAARLGVLVHGPIDDPVIVARVAAPRAYYRALPFDSLEAGVVYHSNVVALAPLRVAYGGIGLRIDGTLDIGRHIRSRFALHVEGPADRLPYLDEMLGAEPMVVDACATGNDLLFHVSGSAASARGIARMAAIVDTGPSGTISVDPFWFHTERGDFDAGYLLDRPHGTSAFWLRSNSLRMRVPQYAPFPGLSLPQMPAIDGRTVAMTLAGGGAGADLVMAGKMSAGGATIAGVRFDRVTAAFGGTLQNSTINLLRASGPWGSFDGHGEFSSQQFVAYGGYAGTFEGLQPFLGPAIPGHGRLAGSVGVAIEPQRILVVGSNLAMRGATLHAVPIDRASLTLGIEGNRLRVYSADAKAAGGELVAAGTFSLAPGGSAARNSDAIALVAKRLQAAQLHGIGLPLDGGTLSAAGELAAGVPLPSFDGAVAVNDSHIASFPITGNGDMRLQGDAVALHRTLGALGGTYARVDGRIAALTSGAPQYDLGANVAAARIASALHSFGLSNYMTDGTFNARLHIAGRSAAPSVSGDVGVPAGETNGLPFVDGSARLSADPRGVAIDRGSVLVGTTATYFAAVSRPYENAVDVKAPHADLADFNNFFDTGDTLNGIGSVKLAAAAHGPQITSSGNIDVRGFRYRNLPIGDTKAAWSSANNVVRGSLAVGGDEGVLHARGSIALTPARAWQSALMRSGFNLGANVDNLDLSLWMPALGLQNVPLTGRAWGEATLRGRFPQIDVRTSARVTGGTLGPLTLDRAEVSLHSAGRSIVIDRAEMTTPALSASASGSMSLGVNGPLDVQVHATTDHLAQLVYDASRLKLPLHGSFESTLKIGGTYRAPTFSAGVDATNVTAYGIPIASLFGEVRIERGVLVISDAGAVFAHGQASLAGSLPLQLSPLRLAAPDQPISFDLDVVGLDPSIFDEALGNNTKMTGLIDGHIGLSGTIRNPLVVGRASLANGSYVSDLERVPIAQIAAALAFNHTSATISRVSAHLGNGTLQSSGTLGFPNGFSRSGATAQLNASARGAQFDLPAYGSGTLDALVALAKRPASDAILSGNVSLSNATLPFSAFVRAAQRAGSLSGPSLPLAFDLHATAGKNVRVRGSGYGAGLDIGVTGSASLAGTLSAPTLSGAFSSTSGTLTYFDRAFRVSQGSVTFSPSDGVIPNLHAVATTSIVNPDPDRARNPYGTADITIRVDGPISGLKVGLTSNPPGYSQDQILGLIAPFGGFINGIAYSQQGVYAQQQPNGITPFGSVSPIPNVALAQRSTITVGQEAFNLLNAQFTAGLLSPVETTLGQGLGLSSINLTLGYYGSVGLTATRLLGKAVSAVYAVTFGIPQIQSFGLSVLPNPETSATLNFYLLSGPTKLLQLPNAPVGYSATYLTNEPLIGNSGFSLTFQRYFW
ncbi:MAG TPA: translocation/assembly module TamB domain-containing protein [Candidatus Babeliales bacterium]|nr:translocation/assembly module TamB domain-containing protein [Candidatus Babeliales bacterium]